MSAPDQSAPAPTVHAETSKASPVASPPSGDSSADNAVPTSTSSSPALSAAQIVEASKGNKMVASGQLSAHETNHNNSSNNSRKAAAPSTRTATPPLLDYKDVVKLVEGKAYQRYGSDLHRVLATIESTPSSEWSTLSSELSHLSRCFQSHKEVAGRTPLPNPHIFARTMWHVLDTQNVLGVQRKAIEVLQSYTKLIINSPYEVQFRAEQQREEVLCAPVSVREASGERRMDANGRLAAIPSASINAGTVNSSGAFSTKVSGRGRSQYVSPLEKDFPFLCVGILHMLPHSPVQLKPELLLYLEKSFLTLLPATLLMTATQGFVAAVLHCLEEAESSSLYRSGLRLLRLLRGRLRMVAASPAPSSTSGESGMPTRLGSAASVASLPTAATGVHASFEDAYASLAPPREQTLGGSQAFFATLWTIIRDVPSMRAPALHVLRLFVTEEMEALRETGSERGTSPDDSAEQDDVHEAHTAYKRRVVRAQREWLGGGRCSHQLVHAALLRALQDEREKPQRLVLDVIAAFFPLLARYAQPSAVASAGATVEPETHLAVLSWVFDEEEHTLLVATILQVLGAPRTSSNVVRRIVSWLDGSHHSAMHATHAASTATLDSSRLATVVAPVLMHTISCAWQWWRRGPSMWLLEAHPSSVTEEAPMDEALPHSQKSGTQTSLSPYMCATFEAIFLHTARSFRGSRPGAQTAPSVGSTVKQLGLFGSLDNQHVCHRDVEAFPAAYMNAIRRLLAHASSSVVPAVSTAGTVHAERPSAGVARIDAGAEGREDADEEGEVDGNSGAESDDAAASSSSPPQAPEFVPTPFSASAGASLPSQSMAASESAATVSALSARGALLLHVAPTLVPMLCDVLIRHRTHCDLTTGASTSPTSAAASPSSRLSSSATGETSNAGLIDHAFAELQRLMPWHYLLDYERQLVRELYTDAQALLEEPAAAVMNWEEAQWHAAMSRADAHLQRFYYVAACVQPFAQSADPSPSRSTSRTARRQTSVAPTAAAESGTGTHAALLETAAEVCQILVNTMVLASRAGTAVESAAAHGADTPPLQLIARRCLAQQLLSGCRDAFQFYYLTTFAGLQIERALGASSLSTAASQVSAVATESAAATDTALIDGLVASLSALIPLFDPAKGAPGLRSSVWVSTLESMATHFVSVLARSAQWRRSQGQGGAVAAAERHDTSVSPPPPFSSFQTGEEPRAHASEDFPEMFRWLTDLVHHLCTAPQLRDTCADQVAAPEAEAAVSLCLWVSRLLLSAVVGLDESLVLTVSLPRMLARTAEAHLAQLVYPLWHVVGLYPTLDVAISEVFTRAYQLPSLRLVLDRIMTTPSLRTIARTGLLLRTTWKRQVATLALAQHHHTAATAAAAATAPMSSASSAVAPADHTAYTVARDSAGLFFSGYVTLLRHLRARRTDGLADVAEDADTLLLYDPFTGRARPVVVRTLIVDLLLDLVDDPLLLVVPLLQSFLISLDSSVVERTRMKTTAASVTTSASAAAPSTQKAQVLPLVLAVSDHAGARASETSTLYTSLDAAELVHHINTLLSLPQPVRFVVAAQQCHVPESVLGTLPTSIEESGEFSDSNGVNLGRMPVQNLFDAIACLLFALARQSLLTERFERARSATSVAESAHGTLLSRTSAPSESIRQPHRPSAALEALQSLNVMLRLSTAPSAHTAQSRLFAAVRCWQYTGLHSVTLLLLATEQRDAAVQAALREHFVEAVQYVDAAETSAPAPAAMRSSGAVGSSCSHPAQPRSARPLMQLHRRTVAEMTESPMPKLRGDSSTAPVSSSTAASDDQAVQGVMEELQRRPPLCLFLSRRPLLQLASAELDADAPNLVLTDTSSVARFEGRLVQWCACVWALLPFLYGELKPFASQFYGLLLRVVWTCQAAETSDAQATRTQTRLVTQRIQTVCYQALGSLSRYLLNVSTALDAEMLAMTKWEKERHGWLTASTSTVGTSAGKTLDTIFLEWLHGSGDTCWERSPLLEELRKPTNLTALIRCLVETLLSQDTKPAPSNLSRDVLSVEDSVSYTTCHSGVAARMMTGSDSDCRFMLSHIMPAVEAERRLLAYRAAAVLALFYREAPTAVLGTLVSVWSTLQEQAAAASSQASTAARQPVTQNREAGSDSAASITTSTSASMAHTNGVEARLQRWVRPSLTASRIPTPLMGADTPHMLPSSSPLPMHTSGCSKGNEGRSRESPPHRRHQRSGEAQWLSALASRTPFLLTCIGVSVAETGQSAADFLARGGTAAAGSAPAAVTAPLVYNFVLALVSNTVSSGHTGSHPSDRDSAVTPFDGPMRACPVSVVEMVLQLGTQVLTSQAVEVRSLQTWVRLLHVVLASLPDAITLDRSMPLTSSSPSVSAQSKANNISTFTYVESVYQDKRYALLLSRLLECLIAFGPLHKTAAKDAAVVDVVKSLTAALPVLVPSSWKTLEGHQRVMEGLISLFQQCLLPTLQHGDDSPSEAEIVVRTPAVKVALRAARAILIAGESSAVVREPHAGLAVGRRIRAPLLQLLTSEHFFRFPRTVLHEWALLWEILSNDRTAHTSACASFSPDTSVSSRLASIVTSFETEGRVRARQIRGLAFYTLVLSPAQVTSREFVTFVKEQILSVVKTYTLASLPSRKQIKDKRVLTAPVRALLLLLRVLLLRFNDILLSSLWPFALVEALQAIAAYTSLRLEESPVPDDGKDRATTLQTRGGTSSAVASAAAVAPTDAATPPLEKAQWLELAALHLDGLKWVDMVRLTHPEQSVFFSWLFCDLCGSTWRSLVLRGLRTPYNNRGTAATFSAPPPLSVAEATRLRAALNPTCGLFFVPAVTAMTCSDLLSQASWQAMQPMVMSTTTNASARASASASHTAASPCPTPTERLFQVAHERLRVFGSRSQQGAARLFLCIPETHYNRRSEPGWCTLAQALFVAAANAEWVPSTASVSWGATSRRALADTRQCEEAASRSPLMWATEAARTLCQSSYVDVNTVAQQLLADFTSHDPDTGV